MRVTFQFLARAQQTFRPIPGLTTVIGRSFQGLVEPRAVWAGVPETYLKKSLLDLKLSLAVGPPIFTMMTRKETALHHLLPSLPLLLLLSEGGCEALSCT